MLIIRGKITEAEKSIFLNCCSNTDDVLIDGKSLYNILNSHFDLYIPSEYSYKAPEHIDKNVGVSYLILDEDPGYIDCYDTFIGTWLIRKIHSGLVTGCYSEMTCGSPSNDYFFGDEGHNIGREFSSYVGKYLILRIDDRRDIIIDNLLNGD